MLTGFWELVALSYTLLNTNPRHFLSFEEQFLAWNVSDVSVNEKEWGKMCIRFTAVCWVWYSREGLWVARGDRWPPLWIPLSHSHRIWDKSCRDMVQRHQIRTTSNWSMLYFPRLPYVMLIHSSHVSCDGIANISVMLWGPQPRPNQEVFAFVTTS